MEPIKVKKKNYSWFIGIDVSKNELDYAVMRGKKLLYHKERKNEPDDIDAFLKDLKEIGGFKMVKALFCMEHTGIYCNHLLNALQKLKASVVLENPLHIKNALGVSRTKDDKYDSIRIAQYAQRNKDDLKLWSKRRMQVLKLAVLVSLRNRYLATSVALDNPLQEQRTFFSQDFQTLCGNLSIKSREAIKADLLQIDAKINELVRSDERLRRLMEVITSVTCVGRVTALQIIISTNEFRDINDPRKFACYAGVAPFRRESGKLVRTPRVSHFANKKMKSLLHMCVISSLRCNEELIAYFHRKTQEDRKNGLLVMNAIRNKLISRIFACVNEDRMYVKDYNLQNKLQQVD